LKLFKYAAIFILFLSSTVHGEIRFSATTERTNVSAGEQVIIKATLSCDKNVGNISTPPASSGDSYTLLHTEQRQSSSSSIQIINGKATQNNEITYDFYYVIAPNKSGSFVFPSLETNIEGVTYHTDPISFNVTNAPVKNPDIRVSLVSGKRSLYVGDQTILTFKVAQRFQSPTDVKQGFNSALETIDKSFGKNFSLIRLFTNQVTTSSERIDGEMYNVFSLRFVVIPLSAGNYNIQPVPFTYDELRRAPQRKMDPFFDDFFNDAFNGGVQAVSKTALSNILPLQVKELPAPPQGFSGAVGKFSLTASADPLEVKSGESVTLKVQINGTSRPGSIGDISLPSIPDCEIFTPEKQVQVDTTTNGIETRKTYKYLLIPNQEGNLVIPSISLKYFDPETGAYKEASAAPISLTVLPGKSGSKQQSRYLTQEEIQQVGRDIRYIKTGIKLHNENPLPYREPVFYLLFPVPFLLVLLSILYRIQSTQKERNASVYTKQRASGSAMKKLSYLKKQCEKMPVQEFLGKISDIIEHFISSKFGFAATGRTLDELKSELLSRQTQEETVSELTTFIQLLDAYRFGGISFSENSRYEIIEKASSFISAIEKGAKKEKAQMPKSTLIFLLILCGSVLFSKTTAAPIDKWFEKANSFYNEQQYDSASEYYNKIIQSGLINSSVYYNLGNTCFRLKKIGLARLYYEKAGKLSPSDPDINANIKYLNSNIADKTPDQERGFIETVLWQLHVLFSLKTQVWICFWLLMSISVLVSISLYIRGNSRLWSIYISVLLSLFLAVTGISTGIKIYNSENVSYSVVLSPSIDARNEPDGHKVLFTAHEGTKFLVRKSIDQWSLVSLPNGISGWVENRDLGKI
jgi:hypothetical protein